MQCPCAILSSVACPALHYFSKLSHKRYDIRKKIYIYWVQNVCFDFPYNVYLNISHSKKKWARYDQKYRLVFMYSTHYSCPILMTREFSQQIFIKILKYQISWKCACSTLTDGGTGGHDEANSRFSQFCERAYKAAAIAKLYKRRQDKTWFTDWNNLRYIYATSS